YFPVPEVCDILAHVFSAGRYIEKIFECMEDAHALSEDGGSAELLQEATLSSMHAISSLMYFLLFGHHDVCRKYIWSGC
ncbi:hypothetical protein F5J12DRAFT_720836, partial [Pisolithus orientalis]|uniref:uncharacterized protein n=1 Tax=Pisolithus orientalis TaxID=936130 RepID=UPI00222416D4